MKYWFVFILLAFVLFGCVCGQIFQKSGGSQVNQTEETNVEPFLNNTVTPEPVIDDSCSSSSDCGYKQKCKGGKCVDVECTSDSQCSGCKRCSDNVCVSCGRGPYGCYC